jgi:putative ABC transport system permease protein
MKKGISNLIYKTLFFYRKSSVYQAAIVFILAAIITGSLLTGYSVKESLKVSVNDHLGNTDILISSGLRYFDAALAGKISRITGEECISILETSGYCQNFETGKTALNTKIYGIMAEFFSFQGNDSVLIPGGCVALNENLAKHLRINEGDEIIIHFSEVTPIPANAPFAPDKKGNGTKVMKVSHILRPGQSGNFTLGISQIVTMNIFINLTDLTSSEEILQKSNRILVENKKKSNIAHFQSILKQSLTFSDIGLSLRRIEKTRGFELISERIFLDKEIIDDVTAAFPSSRPVITYLANSIRKGDKTTPYSFVSALPSSLYPEISSGNNIVVNSWLADDLDAVVNDTISMSWYVPSINGKLEETGRSFIISKIAGMDGIWADPSLMPEFPGIAGSSSCTGWDAGVPVNMKSIRKKDETYWNNFKGTPKAFLEYEKGKELWGNNFGSATAIRFPENISKNEIEIKLAGSFNPERIQFSISDIRAEGLRAARESVDFSTLFLSLGFFIIISCIILLALSTSVFFDSRKDQLVTFFALGFKDKLIEKLLFLETSLVAIAGAVPGVFAGGLINWLIIKALNSVWSGAVQTGTLKSYFAATPLFSGFLITISICFILLIIRVRQFLKTIKNPGTGIFTGHSSRKNLLFLLLFIVISLSLIVFSFIYKGFSTPLSFGGGAAVFISAILLVRMYYIGGFSAKEHKLSNRNVLSRLYYSFYPSHAVTPVIFIAAGIFAVFITGINRLDISEKMKESSGGTGGFLLWCESAIPVKGNLNIGSVKKEFGLDGDNLSDLSFVQAKRSPGDDASCLNLNHVAAPPLLGLDPSAFIRKGSFSFTAVMKGLREENPWEALKRPPVNNIIYGIADQTVLQWGLKISAGDTVILRSENGQILNIIIAAGLKSSVFQGFVIIGAENFEKFYPSVPGATVFLADGNFRLAEIYQNVLNERFANYGFSVMPAFERLASFFEVTNTYLSVFTILGAFGIVLGVAGLGFILLRNYNHRKREFAAMVATGYSIRNLRRMIIRDQIRILAAGIIAGTFSAIIATLPSLKSGSEIPWMFLAIMILSVFFTGLLAMLISVRTIKTDSLVISLRRE